MPAPDIFQIGVSGLVGAQLGLSSTSHNIANVNTEGYSRQRIDFATRFPARLGSSFYGTGVDAGQVSRIFNQTAIYELRAYSNAFQQHKTYAEQAARLDNVVADAATGLNSSLQSFFSALQGVSQDPSAIPSRQVLLSQAEMLAKRFNSLDNSFSVQLRDVNETMVSMAKDITAYGNSVADLNAAIVAAKASAQGEPNDLIDQRDRIIDKLSELVNITTLDQADGSVSVFMGTGQVLVIGVQTSQVTASRSQDDSQLNSFYLSVPNIATSIEITAQMTGGKVGGLLQFRDTVLQPALITLGRVAISMADRMNSQHALGMDLNNRIGGLFFTDFNSATIAQARVNQHVNNTGTASLSVAISNANNLIDSDYLLSLNAGTYTLTRLSDNTIITSFAAPVAPATVAVAAEGFSINFNAGAGVNGDSFKLNPARNAAAAMARVVDDVREIAAAFPVAATTVTTNIGSGAVKSMTMTNTATAAFTTTAGVLTPPLRIVFTSAIAYEVRNLTTNALIATGAFVPNADNNMLAQAVPAQNAIMGYDITIAGAPATGDQFTINYNSGGIGDNRNMQLLARLQSQATMDGGISTFSQGYGRLIANVGTRTHEAEVSQESAQTLMRQAEARKQSISGVNLDEEAANLLRFQQAYEASAQVVSVANSLFEVLFQSVR